MRGYHTTPFTPTDNRITIRREAKLGSIDSQYDFVIASAIIEHLPEPRTALEQLLQAIKPDGIFYARTPYMVPLGRCTAMLGVPLDITYPGHLHDLGQDFWETFFTRIQSGYRILRSRPSPVETSLRKNLLRSLAAHALKAPWHLFGRRYKLTGGWEIFIQKTDIPRAVE